MDFVLCMHSEKYKATEKGREVLIKSAKKHARTIKGRYTYLRNDAKRRNIECTLTFEEYKKLLEINKCYYNCNNPLSPTCTGLDRLNNDKGYINGNVVPCCAKCNKLKGPFLSSKETLETIKLLKN